MTKYEKAFDLIFGEHGDEEPKEEAFKESIAILEEAVKLASKPNKDNTEKVVKEIIEMAEKNRSKLILTPDFVKELKKKYFK